MGRKIAREKKKSSICDDAFNRSVGGKVLTAAVIFIAVDFLLWQLYSLPLSLSLSFSLVFFTPMLYVFTDRTAICVESQHEVAALKEEEEEEEEEEWQQEAFRYGLRLVLL